MNQHAPEIVEHGATTDMLYPFMLGLISWALYDWANSAFATAIQTFVFSTYFTQQVTDNATAGSVLWSNTVMAAGIIIALGHFW